MTPGLAVAFGGVTRGRCILGAVAVLATACHDSTGPTQGESSEEMGYQVFSVDRMRDQRAQLGVGFFDALADSAFRMGLLNGPSGDSVGPLEHGENVVYFVAGGSAQILAGGTSHDVEAGSMLFVRGDVEHAFHSIATDLDAVAVFARVLPTPFDPEIVVFTLEDMVAERDSELNVWSPLLDTSSMSIGMYMLPKGGEDGVLFHDFDEFKIIVNGGGRFDLGSGGFEADPGAIAFIEHDTRHRFRRISDDLDVLVIWAR